jgi:hypothetical protein
MPELFVEAPDRNVVARCRIVSFHSPLLSRTPQPRPNTLCGYKPLARQARFITSKSVWLRKNAVR